MLIERDPVEAYRRVDFDARVTVSTPQQLVDLCFEQLIGSWAARSLPKGAATTG